MKVKSAHIAADLSAQRVAERLQRFVIGRCDLGTDHLEAADGLRRADESIDVAAGGLNGSLCFFFLSICFFLSLNSRDTSPMTGSERVDRQIPFSVRP